MANHCLDVVCLGCGKYWCERGCEGGVVNLQELENLRSQTWRYDHSKDKYPYGIHCCENYSVVSL